jgi:Type I restriction-modification system methyltransferase subunit
MEQDIKNVLKSTYDVLLQPIDIMFKFVSLNKCKYSLSMNSKDTFGEIYYKSLENNKESGSVYTPEAIVEHMLENTITIEDIIKNPFLKILDPSCGSGNILITGYKYLKKIFMENIDTINKKNKLSLIEHNIDEHILKNNIFGIDIDEVALITLQLDLFQMTNYVYPENFLCNDFLFVNLHSKFDVIIANPPYIGHKMIDKAYSSELRLAYKEVYKDKGDISYCFFYKSLDIIGDLGKVSFITSRYFIESLSGSSLRKYLLSQCKVRKIIDFYGVRPFKNVGIDPAIIFLQKGKEEQHYEVLVMKPENNGDKFIKGINNINFKNFTVDINNLDENPWILVDKHKFNILEKIKNKASLCLEDICISYQGIITGCDKAYIVDEETIDNENLDKALLRPWIKNKDITDNGLIRSENYLIYSDLIKDDEEYPNSIEHIAKYKDKLILRRECIKGIRKWYELQWGRDKSIFDNMKIIFRYKAGKNRFILDKGSYFSADIYCLVLKDENFISYDNLLRILNSELYEFYYKSFAKKLGGNLYEYYPNTLMKLKIPKIVDGIEIDDDFLYKYYELNFEEIEIVKRSLNS